MKSSEKIVNFFSKLLNREVLIDTQISLSSAQKARTYDWFSSNNLLIDEYLLQSVFTVRRLVGERPSTSSRALLSAQPIAVKNDSDILASNGRIGIDIQVINELFPDSLPVDPKGDAKLTSIFTLRELSHAQSKGDPKLTLAGIFSAKEAIVKCLGISNPKKQFSDIEIHFDAEGAPFSRNYSISISHSGEYAIAVAVPVISEEVMRPLKSDISGGIENLHPLKAKSKLAFCKKIRWVDVLFLVAVLVLFFKK